MRPLELARWALAPADLDAHRAGAAVPARARRRSPARSCRSAASTRRGPPSSRQQHPDLDPVVRPVLAVRTCTPSPWFAAIYLLLFVSLVGCVLPRSRLHLAAIARPAAARAAQPRPAAGRTRRGTGDRRPCRGARPAARGAARPAVPRRPWPTDSRRRREGLPARDRQPALPPGPARPAAVASRSGTCSATRATCSLVEGDGVLQHRVGLRHVGRRARFADETQLRRSRSTLKHLDGPLSSRGGQQSGAPRDFQAHCRYTTDPSAQPRSYDLRVNHPLVVDGDEGVPARQRLRPGRSRCATATGRWCLTGPVPFLPQDGNYTSIGVVKVPGAQPAARLRGLLPADRGDRPAARSDLGLPRPRAAARWCSPPDAATSASTAGPPSRSTRSTPTGMTAGPDARRASRSPGRWPRARR